jgi:hypothetical protein
MKESESGGVIESGNVSGMADARSDSINRTKNTAKKRPFLIRLGQNCRLFLIRRLLLFDAHRLASGQHRMRRGRSTGFLNGGQLNYTGTLGIYQDLGTRCVLK